MTEEYKIVLVDNPKEYAWSIIGHGLSAFNTGKAGNNQFKRICYALYNEDEKIVGGILGEVYWGWLYVDLLWVETDLRRQGHGHRLLTQLEADARQLGAKHVYLDTFSFQVN